MQLDMKNKIKHNNRIGRDGLHGCLILWISLPAWKGLQLLNEKDF